MTTTPYQFIRRGNLFVVPVGTAINEAPIPTQSFAKPPEYSLWVNGQIREPGLHFDDAVLAPELFREVRRDLARYSPVEVTRSAFRRSSHAYVGVIDSRGTPYYFALDSRGVSVREADGDSAWKAFDRLSEAEQRTAVGQRRVAAADEMVRVDHELSAPMFVVTKGLRYGKEVDWKNDVPGSSWWRNVPMKKPKKPRGQRKPKGGGAPPVEDAEKAVAARDGNVLPGGRRDRPSGLRGPKTTKPTRAYDSDRAAHEAAGGIAVGHSRIRPSRGNDAGPSTPVPHRADRPEHVIVGPGHRVAGEPEPEPKPRGTTSLWRPGDDERRRAAQTGHWRTRERAQQAKTDERRRQSRQIESDERARRAAEPHHDAPEEAAPKKKRGWLSRLFGKGDGPLVALPRCQVVESRERFGLRYAAATRRAGAEIAAQVGEEDLDPPREGDDLILLVEKALPRKSGEGKAKKTPSRKASKKQAGAGGKTRYTYPQEKKGGTRAPLVVVHDDTKRADPAELANQLNVSVRTLRRAARQLGRDGFAKFMRSRLTRFAAKHRLDPDYWNTLYANLAAPNAGEDPAPGVPG